MQIILNTAFPYTFFIFYLEKSIFYPWFMVLFQETKDSDSLSYLFGLLLDVSGYDAQFEFIILLGIVFYIQGY